MMIPRVIKTETDYERTLARIEALMDAAPGTPELDELEVLAVLVEKYEDERYPVEMPDGIAAMQSPPSASGWSSRA